MRKMNWEFLLLSEKLTTQVSAAELGETEAAFPRIFDLFFALHPYTLKDSNANLRTYFVDAIFAIRWCHLLCSSGYYPPAIGALSEIVEALGRSEASFLAPGTENLPARNAFRAAGKNELHDFVLAKLPDHAAPARLALRKSHQYEDSFARFVHLNLLLCSHGFLSRFPKWFPQGWASVDKKTADQHRDGVATVKFVMDRMAGHAGGKAYAAHFGDFAA